VFPEDRGNEPRQITQRSARWCQPERGLGCDDRGNMKKSLYFTIIAVLVMFVNVAYSEDKLIFSAYSDAPPNFWVKDGKLIGVGPELVETIFVELGVPVESKIYPWKRLLMLAEQGDVDIVAGLYFTQERAEYLEYIKPHYMSTEVVVIVAKGKAFPFKKWDDLIGLKGGSLVGDSFGGEFDKFKTEKLNFEEVGTLIQGFEMLTKGRIDYMPMSRAKAEIQARKIGFRGDVEILPVPIKSEKLYMGISKKSPFLKYLPQINQRLKQLTEQGVYEKLDLKYLKIISSELEEP
jgi:polar amino acid transport system substrate-binding protein